MESGVRFLLARNSFYKKTTKKISKESFRF